MEVSKMKLEDFTPAQQEAITTHGKNISSRKHGLITSKQKA